VYRSSPNDLLPFVGGSWASTATAGVFNVGLGDDSSDASSLIGARAVRLLAA